MSPESCAALDLRPLRILERQPQFLCERIDRRSAPLPGPFRLEPQVADPPAPRRNDAADRAEVAAIGMLLIEPPDHIGRHADERPERGRALDAVFAAIPGRVEDLRDLLQIIDEELLGILPERVSFAPGTEGLGRKQLLQLLRERRLR